MEIRVKVRELKELVKQTKNEKIEQAIRYQDKSGEINMLINDLPHVSGRTVRNILKLATLLRGNKTTVTDLVNVSRYQAVEKP